MKGALCGFLLVLAAAIGTSCGQPAEETPVARTTAASEVAALPPVQIENRVWRVERSSAVAAGTLYVFLGDGRLVVSSPGSEPLVGEWELEDGQLSMVEESLRYRVEVLELTRDRLRLLSHNPGEPVEIELLDASRPTPHG